MPRTLSVIFYILLLGGLLAANVTIYRTIFAPKALTVQVLNVGKGSATLVRTPRGNYVLIDTGPDASILRALGATLPGWKRVIDTVILTSSSGKNIGGLSALQERYRITRILQIGEQTLPYGTAIAFDTDTQITVIAPATFDISYSTTSLSISSSTPKGIYISDSVSLRRE